MRKKRLLCIFLILLSIFSVVTPVMANTITVELNNQPIAFDVQPQIINGRTMVPLRAIFAALGATVDWNDATQTVTSVRGNTTVSLAINSSDMYVNGTVVTLDSPACIVNGRTLVPVRAIAEAFGTTVEWNDSTSTVQIRLVSPYDKLVQIIKEKDLNPSLNKYYSYNVNATELFHDSTYTIDGGLYANYTEASYRLRLIFSKDGVTSSYKLFKKNSSSAAWGDLVLQGSFENAAINYNTQTLPYNAEEYDGNESENAARILKLLLSDIDTYLPDLKITELGFINYCDPAILPDDYYDNVANEILRVQSYISASMYAEAITLCNNMLANRNLSPADINVVQSLAETAQINYTEYINGENIKIFESLLTEYNKERMYRQCQTEIKRIAKHPSTLRFNSVQYIAKPDGIHVVVKYEAANALGVYSNYVSTFIYNERLYITKAIY